MESHISRSIISQVMKQLEGKPSSSSPSLFWDCMEAAVEAIRVRWLYGVPEATK